MKPKGNKKIIFSLSIKEGINHGCQKDLQSFF